MGKEQCRKIPRSEFSFSSANGKIFAASLSKGNTGIDGGSRRQLFIALMYPIYGCRVIHEFESNGIKRQLIIQRTTKHVRGEFYHSIGIRLICPMEGGGRSQDSSINTALQILVTVDVVHSAARRPEFRVGRDKFLGKDTEQLRIDTRSVTYDGIDRFLERIGQRPLLAEQDMLRVG